MDSLQGGFQTAPVKLPLTPYQKAVSARASIVKIIQKQMDVISADQVCFVLGFLSIQEKVQVISIHSHL